MDTDEHGCRKGEIYKEAMKTGEERKNSNANGLGKDIDRRKLIEESQRDDVSN